MAEAEAAAVPEAAPEAAPATESWTSGLDELSQGYIENKGWTEPGQLLESYRNLEKMTGMPSERVLQLPKDADDADGWGKVFNQLGRPETPNEYTLAIENVTPLGDGVYNDIRTYAHEAGLTDKQFTDFYSAYEGRLMSLHEAQMGDQNEQSESDIASLEKDWGKEYTANIEHATRARVALGFEREDPVLERMEAAMGTRAFLEHFARIGRGLGEDRMPSEDQNSEDAGMPFGMTPAAAKSKIDDLTSDTDFMRQYMDGQKGAVARMTRLHKLAHPSDSVASD